MTGPAPSKDLGGTGADFETQQWAERHYQQPPRAEMALELLFEVGSVT